MNSDFASAMCRMEPTHTQGRCQRRCARCSPANVCAGFARQSTYCRIVGLRAHCAPFGLASHLQWHTAMSTSLSAASVPEPHLGRVENLTSFELFHGLKMGVGRRYFDVVVVKGTYE